jgi:hypothetical protein
MYLPASVANKRLTAIVNSFRCDTYKKPGVPVDGQDVVPSPERLMGGL